MSECIILWRNTQKGRIGFVSDDDGELAVFIDYDAAEDAAQNTTVCRHFPYQIVEVEL